MKTQEELLNSFVAYCKKYPNQRFWQALRNWADVDSIYVQNDGEELRDTFYVEGMPYDSMQNM